MQSLDNPAGRRWLGSRCGCNGDRTSAVGWQIDPDAAPGGGALRRVEHRLHAYRVVEGDRGLASVMNCLKEVEKGVERGPAVPWQRPRLRHADDPVLRLP